MKRNPPLTTLCRAMALVSCLVALAVTVAAAKSALLPLLQGHQPQLEWKIFGRKVTSRVFFTRSKAVVKDGQPDPMVVVDLPQTSSRSAMATAAGLFLAPSLFLVWGLAQAALGLWAMSQGEMFSRMTIRRVRNLALGGFGYAAVTPLVSWAGFRLLHPSPPPGWGGFQFAYHQDSLVVIVFSGLVAVIVGVMARAAEVAEENAQFV